MNMATRPASLPTAPRWLVALSGTLVTMLLTACGGVQAPPTLPNVLPTQRPADLRVPEGVGGPTVAQDDDGYLYAIGLKGVQVGDGFVLRHGNAWQDALGERPMLGYVRATRVYSDGSVLIQPEFMLKAVDPVGALVEPWTSTMPPIIGKGMVQVAGVQGNEVELSLGFYQGIQPGDRFMVFAPPSGDPNERLGDRLTGIVSVVEAADRSATARILVQGGARQTPIVAGQWAIFAVPGVPDRPLPGIIQVSRIEGDDALQQEVVRRLSTYLKRLSGERFEVETLDQTIDPLDPRFGRMLVEQEPVASPRMLLSGKIIQTPSGRTQLIFNYANTGLSIAHGMIAATPEEGLNVGRPDDLEEGDLTPVFHNLIAAALAHRGQVAEALYLLEVVLHQGGWDGPARWHARDQLAMRYAQTGHLREAIRMVHQDVAQGQKTDDKPAVINAVGTLMPLYEDLEMMDRSLLEAERFYTLRSELGEGVYADHAWRSWIQMLIRTGRTEDADMEIERFEKHCAPTIEAAQKSQDSAAALFGTCALDLHYIYMTSYWNLPPDSSKRQEYFDRAAALAEYAGDNPTSSIRVIQGLELLNAGDFDGALIAFLEARRLVEKSGSNAGLLEIEALMFRLHFAKEDRQQAYEAAMSGADRAARIQDVTEQASIFKMALQLYVNVPDEDLSLAYTRSAAPTMAEALKLQFGANDLGAVAEVFYVSGTFRVMSDPTKAKEAEVLLSKAVDYALQVVRFDIATMSQLTLAMLNRRNPTAFANHIGLAREFARLSGDPTLLQTVIRIQEGNVGPSPRRNTL